MCMAVNLRPQEGDVCTVAGWGNLQEDGGDGTWQASMCSCNVMLKKWMLSIHQH